MLIKGTTEHKNLFIEQKVKVRLNEGDSNDMNKGTSNNVSTEKVPIVSETTFFSIFELLAY